MVPKPPPITSAASILAAPPHATVDDEYVSPHNVSSVGTVTTGAWRPYVVAGAAVLGLLMIGAAALACVCCCRKAKAQKEKDPDRPVYKIYVNNAYIQEDDGEIKVVSNRRYPDDKRSGQVCGGRKSVFCGKVSSVSVTTKRPMTDYTVFPNEIKANISYFGCTRILCMHYCDL